MKDYASKIENYTGRKVLILKEPWENVSGTIKGFEKPLVGFMFRIELDNGLSTLRKFKDFKVIE